MFFFDFRDDCTSLCPGVERNEGVALEGTGLGDGLG